MTTPQQDPLIFPTQTALAKNIGLNLIFLNDGNQGYTIEDYPSRETHDHFKTLLIVPPTLYSTYEKQTILWHSNLPKDIKPLTTTDLTQNLHHLNILAHRYKQTHPTPKDINLAHQAAYLWIYGQQPHIIQPLMQAKIHPKLAAELKTANWTPKEILEIQNLPPAYALNLAGITPQQ